MYSPDINISRCVCFIPECRSSSWRRKICSIASPAALNFTMYASAEPAFAVWIHPAVEILVLLMVEPVMYTFPQHPSLWCCSRHPVRNHCNKLPNSVYSVAEINDRQYNYKKNEECVSFHKNKMLEFEEGQELIQWNTMHDVVCIKIPFCFSKLELIHVFRKIEKEQFILLPNSSNSRAG